MPLALLAAGLGIIVVAVAAAVTVAVDTGFFGSAVTAAFCSGACPSGQMRNTLFLSGYSPLLVLFDPNLDVDGNVLEHFDVADLLVDAGSDAQILELLAADLAACALECRNVIRCQM